MATETDALLNPEKPLRLEDLRGFLQSDAPPLSIDELTKPVDYVETVAPAGPGANEANGNVADLLAIPEGCDAELEPADPSTELYRPADLSD